MIPLLIESNVHFLFEGATAIWTMLYYNNSQDKDFSCLLLLFILNLSSKEQSRGRSFQKRKLLLSLLTLDVYTLLHRPYLLMSTSITYKTSLATPSNLLIISTDNKDANTSSNFNVDLVVVRDLTSLTPHKGRIIYFLCNKGRH